MQKYLKEFIYKKKLEYDYKTIHLTLDLHDRLVLRKCRVK